MNFLRHLIHRSGTLARFLHRHGALLQAIAGGIALALGFWGWSIKAPPADFAGWFNNLFRTLQLITLQFPTSLETGIPWQLHIARLAVPFCAALATFNILLGSLTRPLRLALLPYTRDHILLSGHEQMTEAALTALAARGRSIVTVAPVLDGARRDALEGLGITCAEGDPLLPGTFAGLNLKHASALFLTHENDLTNLNLAMLAMDALAGRPASMPPLLLGVLIDDEALAVELDAALDGIARRHAVRYHRICPDREGLRIELRRHAPVLLKPDRELPSHILVAGLAGRWEQTLMQLITSAQDHPDLRPRLTLLVSEAEAARFQAWQAARPELSLIVECTVLAEQPPAPPEGWAPPHLAVILREDAAAVTTALWLRRPSCPLDTAAVPILVRQSQEDRLLARLGQTEVERRNLSGLVAFGGLLRAESLERVLDRAGEEIAIALHAAYQETTKTLPPGSPESVAEWDRLPENLRDANRAAAEHVPILLAAAGLRPGDAADDETLGRLARIEHRRWMSDRIDRGWRYAPVRDNARRLHPSLRDYDELPHAEQEKDSNQVRTILALQVGR